MFFGLLVTSIHQHYNHTTNCGCNELQILMQFSNTTQQCYVIPVHSKASPEYSM